MKITAETLYEISSQVLSYSQICDYFGLSDEDRKDPSCGQWIIEWIKDFQQIAAQYKTAALRSGMIPKPMPTPMNPLLKKAGTVSQAGGVLDRQSTTNAENTTTNDSTE